MQDAASPVWSTAFTRLWEHRDLIQKRNGERNETKSPVLLVRREAQRHAALVNLNRGAERMNPIRAKTENPKRLNAVGGQDFLPLRRDRSV